MTSRTMTVRAQLGLLAALSCTVFVLALGGALWQMQIGGARLSGFVDNELAAERDVTRAYAQGRQMGQRDGGGVEAVQKKHPLPEPRLPGDVTGGGVGGGGVWELKRDRVKRDRGVKV